MTVDSEQRKEPVLRPLQRAKPQRVAAELRQRILDGTFSDGHALGTEAELLNHFGVSRPSLREALRILEAEGLISIVRGVLGGVVVHRPDQRIVARAAALVLEARQVPLSDVFDAYALIEPAAARGVALARNRRKSAQRLRTMIEQQLHYITDPLEFTVLRRQFHAELVTLAGNQTLSIVVAMLNEVIARAIEDAIQSSRAEPESSRRAAIRAHELLASLIEEGHADEAMQHWSSYLAGVRKYLIGERAASTIDLDNHL